MQIWTTGPKGEACIDRSIAVTISGKTCVVKEITLMHVILGKGEDEILIPSGSVVTKTIQKQI